MNDLTENLATPDNSRNCEEPPKLPLAFTGITGIQPVRLTKIIGLNAKGGMRKETSAMLSRGKAQRVVVADLSGLKTHLETLTSAQAVTWGVTKDDAVAVTGCTMDAKPSRNNSSCRALRPDASKCSARVHTASYSINKLTLAASVICSWRARRSNSADAPDGLRKAATITSVSRTIFI
jgi:hypothetical protein